MPASFSWSNTDKQVSVTAIGLFIYHSSHRQPSSRCGRVLTRSWLGDTSFLQRAELQLVRSITLDGTSAMPLVALAQVRPSGSYATTS